ncbi:MBL fold metallo-hydrolase [Glaciimonas sp. GG7]
MKTQVRIEIFREPLAQRLASPEAAPGPGEVILYWLGQAGFIIDFPGYRVMLDPYLSDSLARKYQGTAFPHQRMMAAPILPEQLQRLDLVMCTHRHTDHMDPDTLQALAARFPHISFLVPAASIAVARKRCGVEDQRLIAVNVGHSVEPLPGLRVRPLPSAHETLDIDTHDQHEWLGYVIDVMGVRLYHSGDCIPYPALAGNLAAMAPQVALLPVNGRDMERSGNGVPGNFTLDEAIALCRETAMPVMVAHHYGMFDFNTVAPDRIDRRAQEEHSNGFEMLRAQPGWALRLTASA